MSAKKIVWLVVAVLLLAIFSLPAAAEEPAAMIIAGKNVDLKAEPFTKGKALGRFAGGEAVVVLCVDRGTEEYPWYQVIAHGPWSGGALVEGWVYGQFLKAAPRGEWFSGVEEVQSEAFDAFAGKTAGGVGHSPEEALKLLGEPQSRRDWEEEGRHNPGDRVKFTEVIYPGLSLFYFSAGENGGLIGAHLTEGDWALGEALSLGAPARDVFLELGAPQFQDGPVFAWGDMAGYGEIRVTFSQGKVVRIDFDVFPD